MQHAVGNISMIFIGALAVLVFFVPSMTAVARRHVNALPVFLTNLLLGPTVVGWAAALIWSFTNDPATAAAAPSSKSRAARFLLKLTLTLAVFLVLMMIGVKSYGPPVPKKGIEMSKENIQTGVPVPADELFGK